MEKELAAVVELISEGVIYQGADGFIKIWNQAAADIFGLSREQATQLTSNNHDWRLINEDGSPCPGQEHPCMQTLSTGRPLSEQVRGIKRPDGSVTWLSIDTRPVFEPGQERPSGVVISFRDISRRKKAQEQLRQSEERYRHLVQHAPAGIYEIDLNTGLFLSVNDVMCRYTGYGQEEFLKLKAEDLLDESSLGLFARQKAMLAGGQEVPPSAEYAIRAKDGTPLNVLVNTSLHRRPSGQLVAWVVAHDIGQRKRWEMALRARLRLMEASQNGSLQGLLRQTLDEVEDLTDSLIGFFHFVGDDQKTLHLQAWSKRTTTEFCTAQGQGLHYPLDLAGVWADCVRQRQPVVHNDYPSLEQRKGLPPGHAAITRELTVPIFRQGRIVAVLGVGNKPTPYTDDDVGLVNNFADLAWDIAQRMQAQIELRLDQQRLRVALAPVDLAVFQQDRDLRYTWMYKPQLGYQAQEVVGHSDAELMPAADAQRVMEIKRGVLASGRGDRQEVTVGTPQGVLTYDLVVEPLRDEQGALVGITGSSLDITRRKRNEARVAFLAHAANAMLDEDAPAQAAQGLCEQALILLDCQMFVNYLCDPASGGLRLNASGGISEEQTRAITWLQDQATICGHAAAQACRMVVEDVQGSADQRTDLIKSLGVAAYACHPLLYGGKVLGTLSFGSRGPSGFSEEDLALMKSLADLLAMALRRRQAEEALRQSEERFHKTFHANPVAQCITNRHGQILEVNQAFLDGTGYSRQELLNRTSFEMGLWDAPPDRQRLMAALTRSGRASGQEATLRLKSGEKRRVLISADSLTLQGQECLIWAGVDVTQRVRAERALRQSEEKFRQAFQLSPLAMSITRLADGQILLVNEAHQRIFGGTVEELTTRATVEAWVNPEDRARLVQQIQTRGYCRDFQTVLKNLAGQEMNISLHSAAFEYEGQPCILSVLQDLTQALQAEDHRRQLEAQLRQSQKMEAVGTLAAGIAHEFNNLLAIILGYAELAQDEARDRPDILGDLRPILEACQRGRDMVRQLAAYSRREEPEIKPLDLNREIKATRSLLERLLPPNVTIATDLADELPAVGLNPGQLQQVLINLASNAVQAMPRGGGLTIRTQRVNVRPALCSSCGDSFGGDLVLLEIRDTGQGMDQQTAQRIFDPFFTTKGVGAGSGLGLSMVQGIVQNHGGHIVCHSVAGQGTAMRVYLPIYLMERAPSAAEDSPPRGHLSGHETVLVVDDEDSLRLIVHRALSEAGYQVLIAIDGEEALRLFEDNRDQVDLVVLDLGMPGMGGQQCLERLLALAPGLKVVVASGYTSDGQDQRVLAQGAQAFVAKPFRKEELLRVVRQVLDQG